MNLLIVTLPDPGDLRLPVHRCAMESDIIVTTKITSDGSEGRVTGLINTQIVTGPELVAALITALSGETP